MSPIVVKRWLRTTTALVTLGCAAACGASNDDHTGETGIGGASGSGGKSGASSGGTATGGASGSGASSDGSSTGGTTGSGGAGGTATGGTATGGSAGSVGSSGQDGSATGGTGGSSGSGDSGATDGAAGACATTPEPTQCSNPLSCQCCPAGGNLLHCLCSTICSSNTDCQDPARPVCSKASVSGTGICIPSSDSGFTCCWLCK